MARQLRCRFVLQQPVSTAPAACKDACRPLVLALPSTFRLTLLLALYNTLSWQASSSRQAGSPSATASLQSGRFSRQYRAPRMASFHGLLELRGPGGHTVLDLPPGEALWASLAAPRLPRGSKERPDAEQNGCSHSPQPAAGDPRAAEAILGRLFF